MAKSKKVPVLHKDRNPVACDPLLRKGGAHGKSQKAERSADRRRLQRELTQIKAAHGCLDSFRAA